MSDPEDDFKELIDPLVEFRAQLPPTEARPPRHDMRNPPDDVFYPDGPPELIPVSLLKTKYADREVAMERALYLCELRGLVFVRMFETARCYVAHCRRAQ